MGRFSHLGENWSQILAPILNEDYPFYRHPDFDLEDDSSRKGNAVVIHNNAGPSGDPDNEFRIEYSGDTLISNFCHYVP